MKVASINPGKVFHRDPKGWTYNIYVNGQAHPVGDAYFRSASAAKQMMRENVNWLRRKHGLTKG